MKLLIYLTLILLTSFNVNALIVINEIMYNPIQDDNYNEWLEIYNNDNDIDLTGWMLCDKELLNGYVSRADESIYLNITMTLKQNQYAIITDGGTGTEAYNNFLIDNNSIALHVDGSTICSGLSDDDIITLKDSDGNVKDAVHYHKSWGADNNNKSLCKLPDGTGLWQECISTPGKENNASTKDFSSISINEFLPDPIGQDDAPMPQGEFIELYNSGDSDLDINDLYFQDEAGHKLIIDDTHASSTRIKAKGFLVIYVNGFSGLLNNDQDKIKLYYSNLLIDEVSYSTSKEGFSWNKVNDVWQLNLPSPNEKNIENLDFNTPRIQIKDVDLGTDEKVRFGEQIEVKINVYKGDSRKNSINVYVANDDKKISEVTNFNVFGKFVNYSLNVPVLIDSNCNNRFKDGGYDLIVSGLDLDVKKEIRVEGIISSLCNIPVRKVEDDINIEFLEVPEEVEKDKEVNIKIKLENNSTDNVKLEVWSYLYRGSASISGEREENLKTINLPKDSLLILDLTNNIEEHVEAGDYKLKVKIKKGGRKTTNDFTTNIKVVDKEIKEETEEKILNDKNDLNGKIVYESSDIKTKNIAIYLLILILIIIIGFLLIRKSL